VVDDVQGAQICTVSSLLGVHGGEAALADLLVVGQVGDAEPDLAGPPIAADAVGHDRRGRSSVAASALCLLESTEAG
jgi:hypothetical protein